MAEKTRGERTVQLFAHLISNPDKSYSISNLMEVLQIPEGERRNVQRDMSFLVSMNNGAYIQTHGKGRSFAYQSAIKTADRLLFPNFENTMLHFVFLQRIANIYPATSELIFALLVKINKTLPANERKALQQVSDALNTKILFMGTPPNYDEDVSKHLPTILNAIRQKRKVQIKYTDNWGTPSDKPRVPLMIAISHGDIYIGCVSQHHPDKTYALKLQRIESVKLLKETFEEDSKVVESLRKRIRTGSLLLGDQNPQEEKVVIYFPKYAKNFLKERPYHRSMKMEDAPGDEIRVTMKVEVNELLKQWIMYYGIIATVEQPKKLRQMILETAKKLVEKYEK